MGRPSFAPHLVGPFVSALLLWSADGAACGVAFDGPNVVVAARSRHSSPAHEVPKDAGIVFRAALGPLTEAQLLEQTSIEVRLEDGSTLAGALEHVGRSTSGTVMWRWRPDGGAFLPVGSLQVKVVVQGRDRGTWLVAVEDRLLQAPAPIAVTVQAERSLFVDPSSPKVACYSENTGGSCHGNAWSLPTRALVQATITARLSEPTIDESYFDPLVRIFARRNGQPVATIELRGWTGSALPSVDADEFCGEASTLSFFDGREIVSPLVCVPNTVDRSLPEPEETEFIKQSLMSCTNAVYPPGASADDPTGRRGSAAAAPASSTEQGGASGDGDGCAIGGPANTSVTTPLLLLVAAGALRRRRRTP